MDHYKKTTGKNKRISWKHRVSSLIALILVFSTMVTMVFPETVGDDDGAIKAAPEIVLTAENAANGTEGEDGDEPVAPSGGQDPNTGGNTSASMLDFIPPGTITLVHADGTSITEENPAVPGEKVQFFISIAEFKNGLQFDMNEMTLNIPAGLEAPNPSQSGQSTVTIKDVDGQIYDLPNTYTIGSDGVIRYTWNKDRKEERPAGSGIIHDVYQLALLAENFSYSLSFEMTIGTDADSVTFTDDISFPVDRSVSLTVTKAITIPGIAQFTTEQRQAMTFALYYEDGITPVKDKNGNNITWTYDEMRGTSLANASIEFTGLKAQGNPAVYPAVFVVKETGYPDISGYTFVPAGDNVVTEKTVEIPLGESRTAELTNVYSKDFGHLRVKKSFPEESALNLRNLTTAQEQLISFTVKDSSGNPVASATLSDTTKFDVNGVWDIGNLVPGTYTVEETTADLEGYTRTTTYTVSTTGGSTTSGDGITAPVTVVKDGDYEVEFANTYTEETDKLKLKKTFEGAALTDEEKANITFTITGPGGTITKHYSDLDANGELVIDPIQTGTYTVTETNVNPNTNNYTVTSTYSVNGGTSQTGTSANSVPVTVGGINEVDFVNTYTEVGKITLTKGVGGDYWDYFGNTYDTQAERRQRIRAGVTYKVYRIEGGERTEVQTIPLTSFSGTNDAVGTYTISNLPVGTYEIDEIITGDGSTGAIIVNTVRTTTVTVNSGTPVTSAAGDTPVASGNFAVEKGGTATVAYQNDYNIKKGKIQLDKLVYIDGEAVNPSTLTEAQQKAITFTITGTTAYNNKSYSKTVTLYDVLHHQNGVDANGYLEVDYGTYTVKEDTADIANYIRVTTTKLDSGEFTATDSVTATLNDDNTQHSVTYKNEYTNSGRLKIDKTVTGLSSAEEAEVRAQIYFTIATNDNPSRPIIKENGKYKLGQSGDTPAHIPLSELTAGIDIPTGTYIITEHNMAYHEDYYNCSTSNLLIVGGQTIYDNQSAVSGNTEILSGNEKLVYYTNAYSRIGVGSGVTVRKRVYLDGVEIGTDSSALLKEFDALVKGRIRFVVYNGSSASGTPYGTYTYADLQDTPLSLFVGTWTIKETDYGIEHYNHVIKFTVTGAVGGQTIVSTTDTVTFTLAQDSVVGIDVVNAYIPLGNLEVKKLFGDDSELKASDLTDAQKKAIKFSVIGYKDTSLSEVVWPSNGQPRVFSYYDMTNGVMTFNNIPTGVYVVKETDSTIADYNVTTTSDPTGNAVSVPYMSLATKTFTNTYKRQKGNLEIQKTFEGPLRASENKDQVTFTVTGPDPTMPKEFTYADMDEEGKLVLEGLITGKYTVKETNADYDFFERTTTVSINGGADTTYSDANGATASVGNNATASVHITNKYKETGALIINKSFDDSECINKLTDAQKKAVKFTIKRVGEGGATVTVATITYDDILKWNLLHPDQNPAGYRLLVLPGDYIVEESNANFTGYTRETTAKVKGSSTVVTDNEDGTVSTVTVPTIVKFTEADVAFNNEYNEKGSLKIKKSVQGLTLTAAQAAAIKFTITGPDSTMPQTISYADILNAGGEYTFENLAAGSYTVEETVTDESSVFYGKTRRTFVKVGTSGWTENSATGEITVDKNGQTVTFRNEYGNSDKLHVEKSIGGAPYVYLEKDGSLYPVWKFNLRIDNLEPSTTNNGTTDIIDTYDSAVLNLFNIVTSADDLAAIDQLKEGENAAANANKLIPATAGETAANVTLTDNNDGTVTFEISGVTADTAKSNNLTYYLIPKDAAALATLNARAGTVEGTPPNQLKKYFSNIAKYRELPRYEPIETNKVDYQYEKTVVIKRCLNYNVETQHLEDEQHHVVDYALYEFIINPEKMKLSADGYVDVTDEYSTNQSVDIESITVERYDPATDEATAVGDGDVTRKDLQGHSIVLTLRDETCFRVRYKATILYTTEEVGHPVQLNNEVTVAGYTNKIEPEIIPTSGGGGSVYQIKLRKYENGNLDNTLKGAEFKMYLTVEAAQADKAAHDADPSVDYPNAVGTYTTDADGVIVIQEYTYNGNIHHIYADKDDPVTYAFIETKAPTGYELIDYIVQVRLADEDETAIYGPDVWIYLPSDTVGIKDYPFDTMVALGALKKFETHGSERELEEGEFKFRIRAKNNENIPMPEGTVDGEKIVTNDADGKAVFGAIAYDTEDVITRDNTETVVSTSKTFVYEVSEVLPDGLDADGNKNGVHYDTHVYEVAVTVEISNGDLVVTSVKVDGEPVTADSDKYEYHDASTDPETVADVDLYFAGLENEYTAEGTWTPDIQKDLQGRPLEEGEFTFQIIDKDDEDKVLATGTNNADGTVSMTPESLTFRLADLGENKLQVKEVYTIQTDDGIYSVAEDVDVTVTVTEKVDSEGKPVYDGELNVTAADPEDPELTLTAPIVMTNKFRASGSWHPKAEKTMDGVLKINEGDYSFELAAVGNAPMPEGAENGKLVIACDEDGKVDFGQIDFYQGNFDDVEYTDGDKEFHYTIREVIPDPEDRIFGVVYDDTVYNITVTTTINKTNKLGVAVTCDPEDGWDLDESTATFTGQFENTYGPTPAKAQPGYEKYLTGEIPTEDVTFEFKLEKAAGDNGDFDYVKVGDAPFTTQTKTLTLGPSSQTDSGLFDEITFLVEGTYKFKITETPNTNGALDPCFVYDSKEYTYTVVVTGVGENLQAAGAYSSADEDQTEQTAEIAVFTNKYTPAPTLFIPKAHKRMSGEPTVEDKTFTFTMTPDAANPDEGVYHDDTPFQGEDAEDTVIVVVPAGQTDAEELFSTMTFRKAGTYKFHVEEIIPATPIEDGITYDTVHWTLTIEVEDRSGQLTIISNEAKQDKDDGATDPDGMTTFTNHVPKTDDVSDMYLNAGMMLASGLLLLLIAVFGRKRKA